MRVHGSGAREADRSWQTQGWITRRRSRRCCGPKAFLRSSPEPPCFQDLMVHLHHLSMELQRESLELQLDGMDACAAPDLQGTSGPEPSQKKKPGGCKMQDFESYGVLRCLHWWLSTPAQSVCRC
mmetsp:Transcript_91906/g.163621  ORF Transcript_91906/g.163621 Transcript_91906/m.163621 type:complete len:125 (+) Transcript_91906:752-1126(+)